MQNKEELKAYFDSVGNTLGERKLYEYANRAKKNGLEKLYAFLKPLADSHYAAYKNNPEEVKVNNTLVEIATDAAWQEWMETEDIVDVMKLR